MTGPDPGLRPPVTADGELDLEAIWAQMDRQEARRANAYVPRHEHPSVSVVWDFDYTHAFEPDDFADTLSRAWDRAREDPAWSAWLAWHDRHCSVLASADHVLLARDVVGQRFRRSGDNVYAYLAADRLRADDDPGGRMRDTVAELWERAARHRGLEAPPPRPRHTGTRTP